MCNTLIMSDNLLTLQEAAELLQVHWQTVRNYLKQGKLTGYKVGKLIRVKREDVEVFLHGEKPKPAIEYEQRYMVKDGRTVQKKLLQMGAVVSYQAHLIDHWFLPRNITSRSAHDEWFDKKRGCGVRIREQDNGYTGKVTTTLEAKRLTEAMNHNTFLEAEVDVDAYEKAKMLLELMDLKEFLTIDKNRVMYEVEMFKISFDEVKGLGAGIEIEVAGIIERDTALAAIRAVAERLGISDKDKLEKSMTVLAMDTLAKFDG